MHGSPCQDFSLAGKQAGGDKDSGTRSSLMYETLRIVENLKSKYVIWENVKNLLSKKHRHNFDSYLKKMEELGYTNYYQVLNAKNYGIPQNRERVFTISIKKDIDKGYKFPPKQELKLKLKDMLEDEVDEKYYLSDKMIQYISSTGTANFKNPDSKINLDVARPLTTNQNKRAGTTNYLSDDLPDNYNLSILIKNNTKKGYLEAYEGDGVYTVTSNKRGTVQHDTIQTITTRQDLGVVVKEKNKPKVIGGIGVKKSNGGTQWFQQDRIYDNNVGISVTTSFNPYYSDNQLRIRKLTPKECWRLMGFDDADFERAAQVNSNTQLYKQAGNSIVVNVLEAILRNLLKQT
jgi:DNA (cytosine-5)-methyltransferase 1